MIIYRCPTPLKLSKPIRIANGEFRRDDPVQLSKIIGGILDGLDLSADGLELEQRKEIYQKGIEV